MKREHFVKVVEEALDSLPQEFRSRIRNVAILVEEIPPNQPSPQAGQQMRLLLGVFHGVPTTKKSIFDLPSGPDHIVLYQKNIEAVCSSVAEIREQIRESRSLNWGRRRKRPANLPRRDTRNHRVTLQFGEIPSNPIDERVSGRGELARRHVATR